ncbi:MAG TPA: uracil-DNA glycosylase family protein, partial [Sphingomicrobium sp.]|nr:uracil-DNA glycosylase family protein [Sphingomicrobium sp.]
IHSKPDAGEIQACRFWLKQERELIRAPVTVALGATAARSLVGKLVTIKAVRGKPIELADGSECWVTMHPSAMLRMPDRDRRRAERERFVAEMKRVWKRAEKLAG